MTPMRSFLYYAHWRLRTVNLVPAVIMRTFSLFKSNFRATYLFLFMSIFVTACSSTQPISDSLAPETGSENVSAKPADKQKAGKTEKAEKTMSEEDLLFSLLRNEYLYWKGTPYLDELRIKILPEATIRILALEYGDIDFLMNNFPLSYLPHFKENENLKIKMAPGSNFVYLGLNLKNSYLKLEFLDFFRNSF